jgi:hypothetical protein
LSTPSSHIPWQQLASLPARPTVTVHRDASPATSEAALSHLSATFTQMARVSARFGFAYNRNEHNNAGH